jgi:hypothetical protein
MGWKVRPSGEFWIAAIISGIAYLILAGLILVDFVAKLIGLLRAVPGHSSGSSSAIEPGSADRRTAAVKAETWKQSGPTTVSRWEAASPVTGALPTVPEAEPTP